MKARLLRTSKLYKGLHSITKDAISKVDTFPKNKQHETLHRLNSFNENPTRKTLEKLVYSVHFHLLNDPPNHVDILRQYPNELAKFWPYEMQHSILEMDDPNLTSQTMLWSRNNKDALDSLSFNRHKWLRPKNWQTPNEELIKDITGVDSLQSTQITEVLRLPAEKIKETLQQIFEHYYFLKTNPKLCATKKLQAPIVEIGMKPDGFDIADIRIDNLFKKKVKLITDLLYSQNPVLTTDAESILTSIVNDPDLNRRTKRLYKNVASRSYLFKDGKFEISELARGGFVLSKENLSDNLAAALEEEHN
ncbi:Gep5 [Kluyveromyces lactis]|nr:Gep5 [Kluyveromyces lactis]